jgi:lysophospholipase L1-like esterase
MKVILCFGDSNTWGYNPTTGERFDRDIRWAGVLRQELGGDYWVIEEGCNGRTTVWDDPIEGYKNGKEYLPPCLVSHKPIDLVTIMLGTNDLKKRFSLSAFDIAEGAGVLVDIVHQSDCGPGGRAPQVLLIAPPPIAKLTDYAEMFEEAEAKSFKLAVHYRRVAQEHGCHLLDAGQVIVSSPLDGIHFEAGEHAKLGRAVAARIQELFA